MEGALAPLLASTGVVAVAEMGDKTQLLALVLAARFRRPWPIVLGILVATLANHAVARLAGAWFAHLLDGPWLRRIIAGSFLAVGAWALVPDRFEDDDKPAMDRHGDFLTTTIALFIVEIGDKTQVATVALVGRYAADVASVVAGTTLGMMLANAPAVWLGDKLAHRLPLKLIRVVSACIFVARGIAAFVVLGD